MTYANVGETPVTINEKSPSQDFPRHDSQTTRSNCLPYFLCVIVCDISIWVFLMKKYFTGTLYQLQVNFLLSRIYVAFMEYFLSTNIIEC